MKNVTLCSNCKTENPFHKLSCINCGSYLRERVYNLDLFKTLSELIESPFTAFKQIIFSEHKNFIIFILILAAGKITISSIYFSLLTNPQPAFENLLLKYFIILGIVAALFLSSSFLLKAILKASGIITKIKDNFSVFIYSFVPYVFGLLIFIIELIIFGEYLFSNNPSPFFIKPTFAYILLAIEILLILWAIFLTSIALLVQTRSKLFSIMIAIFINGIILLITYFTSIYLY